MHWAYAIHRSSMEAGIVIDDGIRHNASSITVSAIGSSEIFSIVIHWELGSSMRNAFTLHHVDFLDHCHPILLCPANHFDTHN